MAAGVEKNGFFFYLSVPSHHRWGFSASPLTWPPSRSEQSPTATIRGVRRAWRQ
ncbi:hypothetical protein ES319_A09G093100v1 [Gossypium barbadense]|uniref:Uncharacterized protein n=2 Tax=Gossypium TaxID=3633 RepID=A0A5J5UG67_GOSBA|nr:hypothetical protein ES319_A09G093100v1 [Gossypium barbadense]TYH02108.1 hypothetical protein ES288_A09G112200v1 [Gossypium darwinii]